MPAFETFEEWEKRKYGNNILPDEKPIIPTPTPRTPEEYAQLPTSLGDMAKRVIGSSLIPGAFTTAGIIGGGLAGGPAGMGLGGFGGYGAGVATQESLKKLIGLPTMPSEEAIYKTPARAATVGLMAQAGGQLLRSLLPLAGALPYVGPKLTKRYGEQIEALTKYGAPMYKAKTLKQQIDEQTTKWQKDPRILKLIEQEKASIDRFTDKKGNIHIGDIQEFKGLAYDKSWEKQAPKWQRDFYTALGNIYQGVTVDLEKRLEPVLKMYGKLKKGEEIGAEIKGLPEYLLRRRLPWLISGAAFWELMRKLRSRGKRR